MPPASSAYRYATTLIHNCYTLTLLASALITIYRDLTPINSEVLNAARHPRHRGMRDEG